MSGEPTVLRGGAAARVTRPRLLFFYSARCGRCRRVEGFLAQVLQRRHNQSTFSPDRIDRQARLDLAERFGVAETPALVVVDGKRIEARLE
jgi:thioredoxin-like negative regulator of GroEL